MIDAYFQDATVEVWYYDTLADMKLWEQNPIVQYIEEPILLNINSKQQQVATIFIQQGDTELFDNQVLYWQMNDYSFFQVGGVHKDRSPLNTVRRDLASVEVRLDKKSVLYGRVADNVFTALESIGGFMESLMHIGTLVVIFF